MKVYTLISHARGMLKDSQVGQNLRLLVFEMPKPKTKQETSDFCFMKFVLFKQDKFDDNFLDDYRLLVFWVSLEFETTTVSMRHRCPRPGAILIRKQAFCKKMKLKKGHNSYNNWRITPKSNLAYIL